MIPFLLNDPDAARAITWGEVLFAAFIAVFGLAIVGVLALVVAALGAVAFGQNSVSTVLGGMSGIFIFSPLLSWALLIPGGFAARELLRRGIGGLGVMALIGLFAGLALGMLLPLDEIGLRSALAAAGALGATLAWLALRDKRPEALVRPA